jgi:hypothetical protein
VWWLCGSCVVAVYRLVCRLCVDLVFTGYVLRVNCVFTRYGLCVDCCVLCVCCARWHLWPGIEPPNVQLADIACLLAPGCRDVIAECILAQCSADRHLADLSVPFDFNVMSQAPMLDPALQTMLSSPGTPGMSLGGMVSFTLRGSTDSVFGRVATALPTQLLPALKDLLRCVGQNPIGSAGQQRPLCSSLRDCLPLSMASGLMGCAWLAVGMSAAVRECSVDDLEVEESAGDFTPHASLANDRFVLQRKLDTNQRDLEFQRQEMARIASYNAGFRYTDVSYDPNGLRFREDKIAELE